MSFDTHKYIKSFISLGIPEPQAEAMIGFVRDTKEYNVSNLATKEQFELIDQKIDHTKYVLQTQIEKSHDDLQTQIKKSHNDLQIQIDKLRIEKNMATKEDIANLGMQIAKQDASQKTWMMGMFLSMIGILITLLFKH